MDRDLGKFSDEQLCSMAASGDDSAMAELISRITPLAGAKAAMYNNGDIHRDDLFQEGMIAFITAVNTYDPKKNASFRTYAAACINNRIISVLRSRNAQKNIPQDMMQNIDDGEEVQDFSAAIIANCLIHRACLLRLAASLAALRLVYKAFLSIELLLAGRENEFLMAVFADESLVFVHLSNLT